MKITFYRYGSICEPDIIRAFKNAGYIVTEYGLEITEKEHTASELVPLFSQFVMDHPCDIIFSINFFPFVSEIAKIMHIPYLSWTVDSPVMELYTSSITNPYNFTFIFDRADAEELAPLNPGHIFHLPLAANVQDKDAVIRKFDTYCKEHGCGLPADQTANCDPACGSDPSFGSCSYAGRGSGFNPRSDFKTNPAFRADSDSLWNVSQNMSADFPKIKSPGDYRHDICFIGSLYTEKSPYDKLPADAPAYMQGYLDALMTRTRDWKRDTD